MVDLLQSADEPPPTPGTRILCRHPFQVLTLTLTLTPTSILCRHPFQETKRAYVTPSSVQPLHFCVWDGAYQEEYKPPFLSLALQHSGRAPRHCYQR